MEVVITPKESVGALSAAKIAHVCRTVGKEVVLGVATGSSPLATYVELAALTRSGDLDLSGASAFALDEYVGLPPGHPESYAEVIRKTVTSPLGLKAHNVHVPDGFADDLEAAAKEYEREIVASGGVDIQIVGVGSNGHIGFNEPGSSLASRTRIKTLTRGTREDNARFFDRAEDVPVHCLTQGLGTIMDAREVVMVAFGAGKADAVAGVVEGPVSARCPGSVLQFHEKATIVVDEAAASRLVFADDYRHSFDSKPEWQRYSTGI